MTPAALTMAGFDPSGGAGLQADLKTFHQHGVYGMSVVTLLTVQNTQKIEAVRVLDPEFVIAQLDAVLADIPPRAGKMGALGNAAVIEALAERVAGFRFPLVIDPVIVSKQGAVLLDGDGVEALKAKLLPHAYLVTPNLQEAAVLAGMEVVELESMEQAAASIARLGPAHVLIKGGHLAGDPLDMLWVDGHVFRFPGDRVKTNNTHGTGCALSAAITASLAKGKQLAPSVLRAKSFVNKAMRTSPGLGSGYGPLNFLF